MGPTGGTSHDPGHAAPDYQLTPERIAAIIAPGTLGRAVGNLNAIALIKRLTAENRYATQEEQEVLAKYVGWGSSELAAFYIFPPKAKQTVASLFSTHPTLEKRIAALQRLEAQLQGTA